MTPASRSAIVAAFALAAPGCKCNRDHPYVPYAIEASSPAAIGDDASAAIDEPIDAGPFHAREAIAAPPNATRFAIDGLDLVAPEGRAIALALTGDFDGDGARDAAALVVAIAMPGVDAGVDPGALLLYRGVPGGALAPPTSIAEPPPLAADPGCAPRRRLASIGRHSIALETGATCAHGSASRWIAAVVVDGSRAALHFRATLLDPIDAPALTVDLDGADRDGDGLDDVSMRASLEGASPPFDPRPRVSLLARWIDRPTGMSRDPDEPEASLRSLATSVASRAARTKDAPNVPPFAEQVRALYRAACIEGGAPRIVDLRDGARALACGASKGLEDVTLAEARAYVTSGDVLRAIAAFDRAELPPSTHTAARAKEIETAITQAAPIVQPTGPLRVVAALPAIDRGASPSWSALAFEPSGALLVRTNDGVVRVDPAGAESAATDVAPWPLAVVSPDGAYRWVDADDTCDGRPIHATFAPQGPGESREVPLPIAPPLGTKCGAGRGSPASAMPIAWGARGLDAIVQGEPISISPDFAHAAPLLAPSEVPIARGAPRSPSGRVLIVPTSMGIFVRGARPRLFRATELAGGFLEIRDCVVTDDASRVACVRGGRAFVGAWPAE